MTPLRQMLVPENQACSTRQADLAGKIERVVMDYFPVFIYLISQDYLLQYTNSYFQSLFGKPATSTPCYALMRKASRPCTSCPAMTVFASRKEQVWVWQDSLRGQTYQVHDYLWTDNNDQHYVLGLGLELVESQREKAGCFPGSSKTPIIRICSYCKDVVGRQGRWQKIETYLGERQDLRFSHGICPQCARIHFPQYWA